MTVLCLLRKEEVKATPEERVRQAFITYLIQEKGVPKRAIAIEFTLADLPHLKNEPVPVDRRIDLLVFSPQQEPLLLIECKAAKLQPINESQLFGYNTFVKAPYLALVGDQEIRFFGHEKFLTYEEMIVGLDFLGDVSSRFLGGLNPFHGD